MLHSLEQKLQTIAEEAFIRALIITGTGQQAFCAGADQDELKGRRTLDGLHLKSKKVFDLLARLPIPTIAAMNGAAIGGGLELALACDIRLSTPSAKFLLPELTLSLIPAAGGMIRLPNIIGKSRAKEMILFGRKLDAATALEWGLVSHVCDDVEAKALTLAIWVAAQDPLAMHLAKKVMGSDQCSEQHDLSAVVQALLYEQKYQKDER
jgi:enoyl-CoA hydratase